MTKCEDCWWDGRPIDCPAEIVNFDTYECKGFEPKENKRDWERRCQQMSFYSDDPIADFEKHDAVQQKALKQLPKCCECGEPIQEDLCFEYNDEPICDECMYAYHRSLVKKSRQTKTYKRT